MTDRSTLPDFREIGEALAASAGDDGSSAIRRSPRPESKHSPVECSFAIAPLAVTKK